MYRIDSPDSVDGRFDDGDEGLGRKATVLPDGYMNAIQAELIAPILHAGIALDKQDSTQLLQAILKIIAPAIPRTGEIRIDDNPTPLAGWVYFDDGTIGDAGTGATTRANADCQALFAMYWNNYPNALLPVSGAGRGASADADWNAGKTLRLPRKVGRALAIAGNGGGLTNRNPATLTGAETVRLDGNQNGRHRHSLGGTNYSSQGLNDVVRVDSSGGSRKTLYTSYEGAGDPHENMQPTAFMHARVKL